jgi:hypothetical protein
MVTICRRTVIHTNSFNFKTVRWFLLWRSFPRRILARWFLLWRILVRRILAGWFLLWWILLGWILL